MAGQLNVQNGFQLPKDWGKQHGDDPASWKADYGCYCNRKQDPLWLHGIGEGGSYGRVMLDTMRRRRPDLASLSVA